MGIFELDVRDNMLDSYKSDVCDTSGEDYCETKCRNDGRNQDVQMSLNRASLCVLGIPEKQYGQNMYNHDSDVFSKYEKDLQQSSDLLRSSGLFDGAWRCKNELNPWEYAAERSKLFQQLNLRKSSKNCDVITKEDFMKDNHQLALFSVSAGKDICESVKWVSSPVNSCIKCEESMDDNKAGYVDSKCVVEEGNGITYSGNNHHQDNNTLDKNLKARQQTKISKFLVVDPAQRITAKEALAHPFFRREETSPWDANQPKTSIYGSFQREDLITGKRQFFPKRAFKGAVMCVIAMHRIKHLHLNPPPISIDQVKRDPYSVKTFRKIIDAGAFRIYGHWVKKGENQNRAALFENVPKKDLKSADSDFGSLFAGTSSVMDINVRSRVGRVPFKIGQPKGK